MVTAVVATAARWLSPARRATHTWFMYIERMSPISNTPVWGGVLFVRQAFDPAAVT